ncbi:hypothetical protein CERZMDRAFT_82652 [Cercospora zeae-maydis SCOH1-5]|uniref:Uncharacterized protein n=1 Tax=Cercospora zeae-maydis SCOH1-5 TaxID=717836 RepID=A0A6A6FMS9_9PEZI|nr:hypothetical protein CERZMDRAFT_82652 [Cercospora zeae-maydis SCOH1-5]
MRTSMVYPNIITSLPPEPAPQTLPDLSRLRIRDRDHDDERRSRRRSPSRRRSRSHRRHRDNDHGHRSSRTTPMHSPRKDVRFFDESPPPRSRKSVAHSRRKSRDAPPAITESAKDTSRRLYQEHRRHHDRGESSSSNSMYGSRPGSRATSRATSRANSRANSPVATRRPEPFSSARPKRPGLDRGYSADVLRRSDLAMTSNIATAGNGDTFCPTVMEYSRPGHRRWHSKG